MALRRKIDKKTFDALSDDGKLNYKLVGNDYVLDFEDDDDPELDDGGTVNARTALERKHRKAAEKRAAQLEAELETLRGEKETTTNTSAAVKAAHDRKVVKLEKERDDALLAHKNYVGGKLKSDAATTLAGRLTKSPAILMPHLTSRLDVTYDGDEPLVVVLDAKGKPTTSSLEDLYKEFRDNKDFAGILIGSQATGGRAPVPVSTVPVGSAPVSGQSQQPLDMLRLSPKALSEAVRTNRAAREAATAT